MTSPRRRLHAPATEAQGGNASAKAGGTGTTLIRGARRIVAWDEAAKTHVYLEGADLAFSGGRIDFVGRGYRGAADTVIDGQGLMLMPGLIDIHSHPSTEPMYRGLNEELGSPGLYNSSLYEARKAGRPR